MAPRLWYNLCSAVCLNDLQLNKSEARIQFSVCGIPGRIFQCVHLKRGSPNVGATMEDDFASIGRNKANDQIMHACHESLPFERSLDAPRRALIEKPRACHCLVGNAYFNGVLNLANSCSCIHAPREHENSCDPDYVPMLMSMFAPTL